MPFKVSQNDQPFAKSIPHRAYIRYSHGNVGLKRKPVNGNTRYAFHDDLMRSRVYSSSTSWFLLLVFHNGKTLYNQLR